RGREAMEVAIEEEEATRADVILFQEPYHTRADGWQRFGGRTGENNTEMIEALLRKITGTAIIIARDLNAKSEAWGGDITDDRGLSVMDLLDATNLLKTRRAMVESWEICPDDYLSDHKMISFNLINDMTTRRVAQGITTMREMVLYRADWNKFLETARRVIPKQLDITWAAEAAKKEPWKPAKQSIPIRRRREIKANE
ncbi:Exo endo phos 2 domain containing protein, partial [Asbolus verrucosus]